MIDFDRDENRFGQFKNAIPGNLIDRVFIVGAWSRPEELRRDLGDFERIGLRLAADCRNEQLDNWNHDLLKHNQSELTRMISVLRPILFESGQFFA